MEYSGIAVNVHPRKLDSKLSKLKTVADIPVTVTLSKLTGWEASPIAVGFDVFKKEYMDHIHQSLDAVILVGFGQYMMHYSVALIMLRGIPAKNIFIIDRSTNLGGCLYQANTFGWFGAPSNPLVFYPYLLYGSAYHKMTFDPLGISSPRALANMQIVREHFGFRVYLGTHWKDVEPILHPNTQCVKPAYRDVLSGRSAGATNGVDNLDLSASRFNLVGMGSTAGDAMVELIRRRILAHGHTFQVILNYRTPRRYTTYMGTLVQPPGIFPFYSSTQFSSLGLLIDKKILEEATVKFPELDRMMKAYEIFEKDAQKRGAAQGFTAIMNVLTYHPMVAQKVYFNKISDRSDVEPHSPSAQLMDCSNHTINYSGMLAGDEPTYRVDFAPNMLGMIPTKKELFLGKRRLPGPLFGQWSTAQGAMGQVLGPSNKMDVSSNVNGCIAQCNSTFYFVRYHSIPKLFLFFQYSPTSVQLLSAWLYDFTMFMLAVTGFTWIFFDIDAYSKVPHQSPEQNFGVIEGRWAWFSEETSYIGPDSKFPCPFSKLPGVPHWFSWSWIQQSRSKLILRMTLSTLVVVACLCTYYRTELELLLAAAAAKLSSYA